MYHGHTLSAISTVKGTVGTFYKKKFKKTSQKELTIEKVINTKVDKLYVKWKDNSFNSWIKKKDIV